MRKLFPQRGDKGFSLIELMIVIGVIGILAAIVIWQYLGAIHKSKQKKTMADIRAVAQALEARATDSGGYNAAGSFTWPANNLTFSDVQSQLRPTYMRQIPNLDGWGRRLEFAINQPVGSTTRADTYGIRSGGKDGQFDANYDVEETDDFNCDIVYSNGTFVVHPKLK